MSQQINLLRKKSRPIGAAALTMAGLGAVLLVLVAYSQSRVAQTAQLRAAAADGEARVRQVQNAIQSLQRQKSAPGDSAALAAEIAELRPRAGAVNQLLKEISSGGLGGPEGFARYFTTLGSVSENGLWVTGVSVTKGGSAVTITGRALRNESVMQYARRLNESFSPYGVRFTSLEMTPEALSSPAPVATPVQSIVAFKLS